MQINQNLRKGLAYLLLSLTLIFLGILLFENDLIFRIILSIFILIFFCFYSVFLPNKFAGNLLPSIGVGILSGLVVNLYRDISLKIISPQIYTFYIVGGTIGIALILIGQINQEFIKSK